MLLCDRSSPYRDWTQHGVVPNIISGVGPVFTDEFAEVSLFLFVSINA